MYLSVNNNPCEEVSYEELKSLFDNILKVFNELYSVKIQMIFKDDHLIEEAKKAQKQLDINDSRFKDLLNKVKQNNGNSE